MTDEERAVILEQLERILSSAEFRRAERSSRLLRFVVEQMLEGQADRLKEYSIGVHALGRGTSFDPRIDPIVRAEASRLRDRLARYYETSGVADDIVLQLPKGSYVPNVTARVPQRPAEAAAPVERRKWWTRRESLSAVAAVVLLALP